jgi:hypothetical protein
MNKDTDSLILASEKNVEALQHETLLLKDELLLLKDELEAIKIHAGEALECIECFSNLYSPEHLNLKFSLDKPQRLKLKGALDFLAVAQKTLAVINETEERD